MAEHRSRHLRGGEERAVRRGRGDEGGARQDRVLAAAQGGGRLLLRPLRRRGRDGRAGPRPAHSPGLDAARREGGDPRLPDRSRPATSSSTTTPTSAGAISPTSTWSRRPFTRAGCSASPACAPTGRTSAAARRAATARPPRSTARACACRPCASTPRASLNRDVEQIIFTNVRTPDERRGDLRAQIAANLRGTTRLAELAVKYGTDRLLQIMQEVMDYSERMMRAALAALPDGIARFEDFCDGDGVIEEGDKEDAPFWIRMQVTKRGDRLIVDFAGHRRPGVGADERAADRHRLRDLHGDQDDRRPARSRAAQFRLLAAGGAARRARHGGERGGARAGGLRQPRDLASRVRHAVRRARAARARARDGVLAGHLGHPDARRRRLPDRRPLRELRDDQGRLRRPPDQGRHQRAVERHLEHDEHADRDPRDELSRAGRALRDRSPDSGGPGRYRGGCGVGARLADARPADPGERLSRAHQVGALRALRRRRGQPGARDGDRPRRRGARAHEQGQLRGGGRRRHRAARARLGRLRRRRGARSRAAPRRRRQWLRVGRVRGGRLRLRRARGARLSALPTDLIRRPGDLHERDRPLLHAGDRADSSHPRQEALAGRADRGRAGADRAGSIRSSTPSARSPPISPAPPRAARKTR